LKLNFIPGDRGARARLERFEVVRRIAALAHAHRVDAVVVAGDVLDDNAVGRATLQATSDALRAFAPIPVLLLPGNHDAGTPDCGLARLAPQAHVRVCLDEAPILLDGLHLHPCPLRRRHEREDPARGLPARQAGEPVRVAIAHGGAIDFSGGDTEVPNLIDVDRARARGFDYLALGDWHGTLELRPWAWYAGAPEATRFKEKAPGNVLLVDLPGPGAAPGVEVLSVARTRWLRRTVELADEAELGDLEAWFAGLDERSWTLVELELRGQLPLHARARLDRLLEEEAEALLHLRVASDTVLPLPSEEDLRSIAVGGWVRAAAEALAASEAPADRDALLLLHRLVQEAR
jgi:DNA repair exonuclease SbcCD nuclease subunit